MKAFLAGLATALVVAVVAGMLLTSANRHVDVAFATSSARVSD